jgi:crotonobetainyl-CoA:carnitine CoA-transferase CaiB-like acyl-CoA transferase
MSPTSPLAGLRVIELARVLAGPWAGQMLADLGADVIKIENPDGATTPAWGPPFVDRQGREHLSAAYFHSTNRGKRSITVDRTDRGAARLVHRLASPRRCGDRELQGRRPRQIRARLPLPRCKAIPARLLLDHRLRPGRPLCRRAPATTISCRACPGFMSVTGAPDGEPMKAGVAVADIFTGIYAVTAILAALHPARCDRRRRQSSTWRCSMRRSPCWRTRR